MPNTYPNVRDSFLVLLDEHAQLDELFLQHQKALLDGDLACAARLLDEYESELRAHVALDDEALLPIYERAAPPPGGAPGLFRAEHRKILELLAQLRQATDLLAAEGADWRAIIALLDEEARFKGVMLHHDLRERNILYPTLDCLATPDERQRFLVEG